MCLRPFVYIRVLGCVFETVRLYQSVLKHFKEHNFFSLFLQLVIF